MSVLHTQRELNAILYLDSSNSGGENMYTLMKPVTSGNMGGVSILDFPHF